MARVTVEDCIDKVSNRFELVLLSGHRARQISAGARIAVERDNDKNPVVALREIAEEQLSPGDLKEDLIHSLQRHVEVDEPEDQAGDPDEALLAGDVSDPAEGAGAGEEARANPTAAFDRLSEDELLANLHRLSEDELLANLQDLEPPEKSDDY